MHTLIATAAGFLLALSTIDSRAGEPDVPTQAQMLAWVESSSHVTPALQGPPGDFHLGFVVTPDFKVIARSAIVRPGRRPIGDDIREMFPWVSLAGSPMLGIAAPVEGARGPGVIWVVVAEPLR